MELEKFNSSSLTFDQEFWKIVWKWRWYSYIKVLLIVLFYLSLARKVKDKKYVFHTANKGLDIDQTQNCTNSKNDKKYFFHVKVQNYFSSSSSSCSWYEAIVLKLFKVFKVSNLGKCCRKLKNIWILELKTYLFIHHQEMKI